MNIHIFVYIFIHGYLYIYVYTYLYAHFFKGAGIYPWEFCISMHFSMLGELKDHKMRRGLVVSEMAATGFEQKKQH